MSSKRSRARRNQRRRRSQPRPAPTQSSQGEAPSPPKEPIAAHSVLVYVDVPPEMSNPGLIGLVNAMEQLEPVKMWLGDGQLITQVVVSTTDSQRAADFVLALTLATTGVEPDALLAGLADAPLPDILVKRRDPGALQNFGEDIPWAA